MTAASADLVRMVQRLSSCRDLDAVVSTLRDAARALTNADGVTVVLRDGKFCHYIDEDAIGPLWKGKRFPLESCISGWAMIHRKQVAITDIFADPRIPHDAYRPTFVKSLAMVPIRSEEPIGAIGAYWASEHAATADELQTMQALADAASVAFANVQLIQSLQDASRRKDEFMSMLAHELRNPLAPMRNALHVMQLRPDDKIMVERSRELMERQVSHLSRMVDDLLDTSRLAHGRVALKKVRLDMTQLVRESVEDRRGVLEAQGLSLVFDMPDESVWIEGDPTRLAQVVGNLLDNARKFSMPSGTVTVRLGGTAADESHAGTAEISIGDTGVGIDPNMLARVFDVFAQEDLSLDRTRGGLGLGLSIARNMVELHGGTIDVASAGLGKGAEFTVTLPVELQRRAADTPPASLAATKPLRVLVVEDNVEAAESMRMLLEMYGYDVTVANTGKEAIATAEGTSPQIVLCDIGLPEMDGFAVARTLRGKAETSHSRLIAVTGYGAEEDRQKCMAAGFDVHLVKPVDPKVLLRHMIATEAA